MPEPSRQFEQGQWATPVRVRANIELDAVGVPDIGAGPAQAFGIIARAATEAFERERDVVNVFGQMGVQHHAFFAREQRGIAHQALADREGRTGRDPDADHGAGLGIVEAVDHADGVVEDGGFVFDQIVGRQAARALADAHRAAGGVEADADRLGGGDGVVQGDAIGEEVEVVGAERAAGQRQFGKAQAGGGVDVFGGVLCPDRVEPPQPVE